jgi:HK97 gp10 family phage protein
MSETFDLSWEDQDPEELAETITEIEEALTGKLGEAMVTAVLLIESTAKELAPVDTGRLRSSIASKVKKIAEDEVQGFVGTNVEYAPYVEWGTSKMEAQPYLRPAVNAHREDIRDLFREAVEESIEEAT